MRLTYPTALVLQALLDGHHHGFDIMDATGLPSGTVYPILRRLDAEGCVRSRWEKEGVARKEQRPPRRYYELTAGGRHLAGEATEQGHRDGACRQAAASRKARAKWVAPHRSTARSSHRPTRIAAGAGAAARRVAPRMGRRACAAAEPSPSASARQSRRQSLVRHALGSFVDAFWIRQRDVADLQTIDDLATRLPPVAAASRICDHRRRHPRAQHGGVGHGVQRRLADPAAAASLSRTRSHRDALGAAAVTPRPPRRRARQLHRLARAGDELHAAGRRRAVQLRLHRRRSAAKCSRRCWSPKASSTSSAFSRSHGRFFRPEEHKKGNNRVVVLSERFWRAHFNGDPAIVGKTDSARRRRVPGRGRGLERLPAALPGIRAGRSRRSTRRRPSRSTSRAFASAAIGAWSAG